MIVLVRRLFLVVLLLSLRLTSNAIAEDIPDFETDVVPILKSHCYKCHGDGASEGNLVLDQFATGAMAQRKPEIWWNVLKNVRAGVMPPPPDEARLTSDELKTLIGWIKFGAFSIDAEEVDPGKSSVRRLNRTEYGNTVSDLMGISYDATLLFPPDDSGFGFDNVGDALTFSPLLMEKYLRAAQSIVAQAVPRNTWVLASQKLSGSDFVDETKSLKGDNLSGKVPAIVSKTIRIEKDGRYTIRNQVQLHGSFEFDPARYEVTFKVDGHERSRSEYGWDEEKIVKSEFNEEWAAGEHVLMFELNPIKPKEGDDAPKPKDGQFVTFSIDSIRVEGPHDAVGGKHPPGYERFFTRDSPPVDPAERRAYAVEVLQRFATRAFRGPVNATTVERLVSIGEGAWQHPDVTFEAGISDAMVAVLASPRFLFRMEESAQNESSQSFVNVSEYELASRLSYFLWSTMPDDTLFDLAEKKQLRSELSSQVARMLKDERSKEFLNNFVGQWLRTRDVVQTNVDALAVLGFQEEYDELRATFRRRGRPAPNEKLSPEDEKARARYRELRELSDKFGDDLKRAMRRETELCVEHIAKENLSLLDLLDSRYTFVNDVLAKHYGITDSGGGEISGKEMRRVELPEDSPRGGVLGHASMLLVTSNPTRTSPVKRGLFVLENLLGTPSPPAPPGVPDLDESAKKFGEREPTLRELLAAHRESALCASCHSRMDPLGLALENFSALGTWRTDEKGQPIDASGQLISGESFKDVRDLKKILRNNRASDFYRCLTQKMLIFAVGRGLEYSDEHTVDLIVARLEKNDGKFNELIEGIVNSAPFQKRRVASQP